MVNQKALQTLEISLGDVARKLQAMQADQGWTTTTGQRIFKDAHHGILAGRDKCWPKCSGWSTQEAPAASSSAPSSSLPTRTRASKGALRQSGRYPSSPWDYKPNYKDGGPSRPRPSFASDTTFKHKKKRPASLNEHSKQKRLKKEASLLET